MLEPLNMDSFIQFIQVYDLSKPDEKLDEMSQGYVIMAYQK